MNLKMLKKPAMNENKGLTNVELEEYRALRNEILAYINAKQNLVYLSLLVIIALIGLQITTERCIFSLCSVITIFTFFVLDSRYKTGIAECGAYIRAKFENNSEELNWETTLSYLNSKYSEQKINKKHKGVTKKEKYTYFFRSIFDSGFFNHFTAFTCISLILGWITLFLKFTNSKTTIHISDEIINVLSMLLTTIITIIFVSYIKYKANRDFNKMRQEFYEEILNFFAK